MEKIFENAKWIAAKDCDENTVHGFFTYKADFDIQLCENVLLYISAFTTYSVTVNGVFADCGQYEDYDFHPFYDVLDITELCKTGTNTVEIGHYVCGENFSTRSKGVPGIIFALTQNKKEILCSGADIRSSRAFGFLDKKEKLSGQLGFNAEYDETSEPYEFRKSIEIEKSRDFAMRPIKKLKIGAPQTGKLTAKGIFSDNIKDAPKADRMYAAFLSSRDDSFIKRTENGLKAELSESDNADGCYFIFDLGGESAGFLDLCINVPEKSEILIGYGEHCDDMRVRSKLGSRNFCFRYVAKPGLNEFFYPYQRIGLRFLQIHVYSRSAEIIRAGIRPSDYPLNILPCPVTDGLHKMIYNVGVKTLRLCMHEHYEDCPWREQALYAMDSRVQMLCGYYAFGEFEFAKAALVLMSHSYRESDGLLELCSPGREPITIPGFTAVFLRQVYEYMLYSGDKSFDSDFMRVLGKIADGFISRIDETGLIPLYTGNNHWNFYEWQNGLEGHERYGNDEKLYEAPLCAFVIDALMCCSKIFGCIGLDGQKYQNVAKKLAENTHKAFFDKNSGAYITRLGDKKARHVLTQSLMLYCGAVPEDLKETVIKTMTGSELLSDSLSMTIFRYEVLLKTENGKKAVLDEIEKRWGNMIKRGADTFWETDKGADDFSKAGSLCHGWSAVPVYIFGKYFAYDIYKNNTL